MQFAKSYKKMYSKVRIKLVHNLIAALGRICICVNDSMVLQNAFSTSVSEELC